MVTYEQLKIWFETHKQKFVLAACFVLVFLAGIGVGRYEKAKRQANKNLNNYSTNTPKEQNQKTNPEVGETAVLGVAVPTQASTTPVNASDCKIKGNIGTGGKIYHIPGGASYKIVKPEMCFKTEAEAVAAGFRKAGR